MAYLNGHEILFGAVGQVQYDPIYQGNLPLDFFSVGGNLSDWTIYGNSEGVGVETENGYKIPLIITNGTETKSVDVYIGDSKLYKGQSVSKSSTGIEIEVGRGQNVIDTTLENKPEMSVVPDSYVKLKQIAMNNNGSYNETQIDFITDNVEEVTE